MAEQATKFDLAIFIAKKAGDDPSKLSEFNRYRAALGNIEPTSINWHPVLICRSRSPETVVAEAYDEIQFVSADEKWRRRFRERISEIVEIMTGHTDDAHVAICAHWGQIDYNPVRGSTWQQCLSFVRAGLPKNWQFALLSSSSEIDRDFVGGDGPIRLQEDGDFDRWFATRCKECA